MICRIGQQVKTCNWKVWLSRNERQRVWQTDRQTDRLTKTLLKYHVVKTWRKHLSMSREGKYHLLSCIILFITDKKNTNKQMYCSTACFMNIRRNPWKKKTKKQCISAFDIICYFLLNWDITVHVYRMFVSI